MSSASRARSSRRRRTMANVVAFVVAVGAIGGFVAYRANGRQVEHRLSAVFIEPGAADLSLVSADANAELDLAEAHGADVIVAAVLDGRDATAFFGSFACEAGQNPLLCDRAREEQRAKAVHAIDEVLQAEPPASVDLFAPLRQVASHLQRHPVADGTDVYLNTSGRHDDPLVDLSGATPVERVPQIVDAVLAAGVFPEDTSGITVHLIIPTKGARADALTELFRSLLGRTGGRLGTVGERWLAEETTLDLPDFEARGVSASGSGRTTTFTMSDALFDTDSAELRPDAAAAVQQIADCITRGGPVSSISVEGFADSTGTEEHNRWLSDARANTVRSALATALDVDPSTISAQGRGAQPDDGTEAARQANRRVDVNVTTVDRSDTLCGR